MSEIDNGRHRTGGLAPFLAIGFLLFTLEVVLPCTIFLSNAQEFSVTLSKVLLVAISALALSLAGLAVLISALPQLRNRRFVAVIFAVAVLVWLQGTVIVWQYGPMDGRAIDWAAHRANGWIDTSIWLAVLGVCFWQAMRISRIVVFVSATLIGLQLLALIYTKATTPEERISGTIKAYTIDPTPKFSLSHGRNVFLIVLDELQSDVFAEIVNAEDHYRNIFDGFTYFPNTVAAANFTELAIPGILTGQLYDNSVPKGAFLADAYLQDSIFAWLKRNGFRVDIYPWTGWGNETIYFDDSIVDNLKSRQGTADKPRQFVTEKEVKEIIHLADLALFRVVPHMLKPAVFNNQQWLLMGVVSRLVPDEVKAVVSTDNEFETTVFAEQAEEKLRTFWEVDAFKYYHLKGAHKPLTVLPDLRVTATPVAFSRERYVLQIKASLNALDRFFSCLKQLGVWDKALIVIVADHGSGETEDLYIESTGGSEPKPGRDAPESRRRFAKDKARGIPLLLIKRENSAEELMRVSEAPVSLLDLPATLAAELRLAERPEGVSIFSVGENDRRTRHYIAFDYSEIKTSYVGPMTHYVVEGHSWEDDSWRVEGILLPPDAAASNH